MLRFERSRLNYYVKPFITRHLAKLEYSSDHTETAQKTHSTTVPLSPPSYVDIAIKKSVEYDNIKPPDLFLKLEHLDSLPETEVLRKSLPFDEVPGPSLLRHLAKLWKFLPAVGTQVTASAIQYMLSTSSQLTWGSNLKVFRWLLDEYGPVVRLHGPFGGDVVVLSRPEHAAVVFQNEGRYPVRSSLDCVEKYRMQFRRYKQAGPFLMNGPEWEKLRKCIERPLQNSVALQYHEIEKTCDELIIRILRIRNKQDEVPGTFRNEICKWALECMACVTIHKRLGFLDPIGLSSSSEPARLLNGLNGASEAIRRCEFGLHLWKFIETPAWKKLVKHCDSIDSMMNKYIHRAQDNLRQRRGSSSQISSREISFIESLLVKEVMLPEDVLTILLDMMIIGVNVTSHSVAFLLYHLARYPRVQRKLFEEIINAPVQVNYEYLKGMRYLQACIKESLRLKPPMPVLSRVLQQDLVVYNYRIPAGTYVLIATHLASLKEEYFEEASRFKPDRWLDSQIYADTSPFAMIPFGHGPKGCLAKDLAELEISLLVFKLLRKFRIEYHYGDINSNNRLLAAPDRPLKLRFVERL